MVTPVKGSCHCGAVRLEAPHAPLWIVQCGCGTCSKLGALWAYYPDGAVGVLGETVAYECNSRVIGSFFLRPIWIVESFLTTSFRGNLVIFDPNIFPLTIGHDVRLDIVVVRIPT